MALDESKQFQIYLKRKNKTNNVREFRRIGGKYEVTFNNGKKFTYNEKNVRIIESALNSPKSSNCFDYLKSIALAIGLKVQVSRDKVINILSNGYSKIDFVMPGSVLATFLSGKLPQTKLTKSSDTLYPFGFNASQKKAVDKALISHLSIIEGPPGTGKTQTILNIITNVVMNGGSVAVVSSNNSAIKNVLDKLHKYNIDFIAATLGNTANKKDFIESQKPLPELLEWDLPSKTVLSMLEKLRKLHGVLQEKLAQKNRLSILIQELSDLELEQKHFQQHLGDLEVSEELADTNKVVTSDIALDMWLLCETIEKVGPGDGFFTRFIEFFRNFNRRRRIISRLLAEHPRNHLITSFQRKFYELRLSELNKDVSALTYELDLFDFDSKMNEHSDISAKLFRARLFQKYKNKGREYFELSDLKSKSEEFIQEYPVILSTTYSLRNSLANDVMYDYVIIDESSQVDLCTGALALSCAKNSVVVGDLKQLAHVVDSRTARVTDEIFEKHDLPEAYRYKCNSLLSALKIMFPGAQATLLREHYRCHPKIIEFCNKKFYDGELIVLTKPRSGREPLVLYKTVEGNHERNRINQRQIDVIKNEILTKQNLNTADGSLGIVTPYRNQTNALQSAFSEMKVKADTVDKFQGQECPVVILSTVDNEISEFADNSNRLNVAISRASDQLIIVVNDTDSMKDTNIGDLVKYIEYNNFTVVKSRVNSVFDYLYRCYAEKRRKFLSGRKRISMYDSENLMHALIVDVLKEERYMSLAVSIHVPLRMIIHDLDLMTFDEKKYTMHSSTHIDFLIFDSIGKTPRLVVEVDGVAFHSEGSRQSERDAMKNEILRKYGLPILRLRTDGSNERDKLVSMLDQKEGEI